jgi:hypothetical protein
MPAKKNIYRYLFISLFLTNVFISFGQIDSTRHAGGFSIGIDVSRFFVSIWNPIQINLEFQGNVEIGKSFSITAEAGLLKSKFSKETYDYEINGTYYRIGSHFNLLKRNPDELSSIYIGLMYGFSPYWHMANHIEIKDNYWGTDSGSLPKNNLFSHWMEFNTGIQVEIFKNWLLGWEIRTRFRISRNEDPVMAPFIIPGFGKGENNFALGISYYIYYRIPYKKRK